MNEKPVGTLVKLTDSELVLANPSDDVRGRTVVDHNGDEVGDVDGILVDEAERKARFLQVGSGTFLGIGGKQRLIPVDAVTAVNGDKVHIDTSRDTVAESGEFHPDLIPERDYYEAVYKHYGYQPFWAAGYVYGPYLSSRYPYI